MADQSDNQAPRKVAKKKSLIRSVARVTLLPPVGDFRQVGEIGRATAALVRKVHSPGRNERFYEALERQGLTLADADARGRDIRRMGHIYAGTSGVALLLIALSPFTASPIAQFVGGFAVMTMAGAKAAVAYFRVSQIRDRELYGFVGWLRGKHAAQDMPATEEEAQ